MPYSNYTPELDINKKILRCPYSKCHTRIIQSFTSSKVSLNTGIEFISPGPDNNNNNIIESIELANPSSPFTQLDSIDSDFLFVNDAWDFDNIAVSKEFKNNYKTPVERLLICANCERGPLGFASFEANDETKDVKNLKFYLHLGSVVYEG